MSRARAKGTTAESAVVSYLRTQGWPYAERRALAGGRDKGDVTGMPAICVEVKNSARYDITAWLKETSRETRNANANHGVLVVKPKGVGDTRVGDWWAVMPLAAMTALLKEAGYGDPPRGSEFDGDAA